MLINIILKYLSVQSLTEWWTPPHPYFQKTQPLSCSACHVGILGSNLFLVFLEMRRCQNTKQSAWDKTIPLSWKRDVPVFFPVISWISPCAVMLPLSSGCSFIFYCSNQFQAPVIPDFKEERKFTLRKVSTAIFVQIMCMNVMLLHINDQTAAQQPQKW